MSAHVMSAASRIFFSRRWLICGFAALTLAACSSPPVQTDSYYRLGAPAPVSARTGGPIHGALEVPPLHASGIVNERAILYRDNPNQLAQYTYHAWVEPPAILIQQALIDALRQAQAFDSVISPEMRFDRDFELLGDVRKWEHVRGGSQETAAIEIEISIRRIRDNAQVLLKTYSANEPTQGEGVGAAVVAFTRGLDTIAAALVADLAAVPKDLPPAPK